MDTVILAWLLASGVVIGGALVAMIDELLQH